MEPESKEDKFLRWAGAYLITVYLWVLFFIAFGNWHWTTGDLTAMLLTAPLITPGLLLWSLALTIGYLIDSGVIAIPALGGLVAFIATLLGTAYALGWFRLTRMARVLDKEAKQVEKSRLPKS